MALTTFSINHLNSRMDSEWNKLPFDNHRFTQILVFLLFVFQSANVQFLFTQHWSFVSSVLSPSEGRVWFAPMAGVGSITSTISASQVKTVIDHVGLMGCLGLASGIIGISSCFSDMAYRIAEKVCDRRIISILKESSLEMSILMGLLLFSNTE